MKIWITAVAAVAAIGAHAITYEFNETEFQTIGDGNSINQSSSWGGNPENILANTATTGELLLNTSDSQWRYSRNSGDTFSTANLGDIFESSITFKFTSTATNTAAGAGSTRTSKRLVGVGGDGGGTTADVMGWLCRSWDNSDDGKYSLGLTDNDDNKVIFNGTDIGITGLGNDVSDSLKLTTTLTRGTTGWDLLTVLENIDSSFTTSYSANGIGDLTDTLVGAVAGGQNDANSVTMDRTVSQMTVIPEPATLGLITAFGGGILIIRRRFMI
ncbi:PEP-CTERM sorting domain-containing protein [Pontiellaceae bacterium B12227]|nr:PEP-CTERM sorting domain-containing protein [Pontiellaceae bacterium B12227]